MKKGLLGRVVQPIAKGLLVASLLGASAGVWFPSATIAASEPIVPSVVIDGQQLELDVPPMIMEGSTMVPMRAVFEAFGATMNWDHATKTVTAVQSGVTLVYRIGDNYALRNGETYPFASRPGLISEGRTLLPLRAVGEALGADVQFVAESKTVVITGARGQAMDQEAPYRLAHPIHKMMEQVPALVSDMDRRLQEEDGNGYVLFGDSLTWGSYLGKTQTHAAIMEENTGKPVFNFGVPGFQLSHLLSFMPYVLQNQPDVPVVVQLQWFDQQVAPYAGLSELSSQPLPAVEEAAQYLRKSLPYDARILPTTERAYLDRDEAFRQERIERGQQLFNTEERSASWNEQLLQLRKWMESRAEQTFYVYIPPYLMSELYAHTSLDAVSYRAVAEEIETVLGGAPNIIFRDFNHTASTRPATDFVDWWHRTVDGERQFAKDLAAWLSGADS